MTMISMWAIIIALCVIVLIAIDLLLHKPRRREDRGSGAAMLPGDVDPASLRRRRPLTQRLAGGVLIAAVIVIVLALRPLFLPGV